MNQDIGDLREDCPDLLSVRSGNVMLDDDDRVYVAAGQIVADKYRIERVLGVGGMGFVVAATHVQLEGTFALKFLKKRFLTDPDVVDRFTREAQAACRVRSDYVARVFDVGTTNGAPFLVMDCLVGRDLAAVLAERGRLSIEDAVEYVVQACAALAAAHACGVVHRDIKPENLFLVESDGVSAVKLLDFGISSVALTGRDKEAPSSRLTGTLTLGTPLYMSPEQIRSTASADAQSDLWSLGVVLYELLTGASPFVADSVGGVCAAILEKEPPSLLQFRPDAPAGLAEIVERCLRKDPVQRYDNVSQLAVALLGFAPTRCLAVAESSSSIRRAAIQALGVGADDTAHVRSASLRSLGPQVPWAASGRLSSASATFASAPGVPAPAPAAKASIRSGYWIASAMAIAGAAVVATLVARRSPIPVQRHDALGADSFAQVAPRVDSLAATAFATEILAAPLAQARGPFRAPDEARVPSRTSPATGHSPLPPHGTPSRPPSLAVIRGGSPPAPSGAVPSDVAVPSPPLAPPLAPGRPDLGY